MQYISCTPRLSKEIHLKPMTYMMSKTHRRHSGRRAADSAVYDQGCTLESHEGLL